MKHRDSNDVHMVAQSAARHALTDVAAILRKFADRLQAEMESQAQHGA